MTDMQFEQQADPVTSTMQMDPAQDLLSSCTVPLEFNPYGQLSDFEVEKKIGKGQFSVVFKAHAKQPTTKSPVALKKVQVLI